MAGSLYDWRISPEEQARRDRIAQGIVQDELAVAQESGNTRDASFLQQELRNRFKKGSVESPPSMAADLFSAPTESDGWKTIDAGWAKKATPSNDGWKDVSEQYRYIGLPEIQPASNAGFMSDTGNLLKSGVNQIATGLREATRQIPGVGESIVSGADAVDEYFTGKKSDEIIKGDNERIQGALSPSMREAMSKQWWDEETQSLGPAWTDKRSYAAGIIQSLPSTVLTMVPAARLAKLAFEAKAAELGGTMAAEKVAEAAARSRAITATVAGGVGEGVLSAGQTGAEVRDELGKLPQSVWESSEAYKALLASGMKPEEAKQSLTNDAATKGFLIAGVTTALFGGQGDRVLANAMSGRIAGGIIKRGVVGAVGEGGEEFGQSYAQEVAKNVAVQTVDPSRSTTAGALNAGLGGLAVGAVQGAGMNMALGRTAATVPLEEAADAPITPVVTPDQLLSLPSPTMPAGNGVMVQGPDGVRPQTFGEVTAVEQARRSADETSAERARFGLGEAERIQQGVAVRQERMLQEDIATADREQQDAAFNAEQIAQQPFAVTPVTQSLQPQSTESQVSSFPSANPIAASVSPQSQLTEAPTTEPPTATGVKKLENNIFTDIFSSTGQPFQTEKSALTSIKARGIGETHTVVAVDGGFSIRSIDAANVPAATVAQPTGSAGVPSGAEPSIAAGSERVPTSGIAEPSVGQPEAVADAGAVNANISPDTGATLDAATRAQQSIAARKQKAPRYTLAQTLAAVGGINSETARDLTGENAFRANAIRGNRGMFAKRNPLTRRGNDLSGLIEDGLLDDFLPPAMRTDAQPNDRPTNMDQAVEYLTEKIRNGEAGKMRRYEVEENAFQIASQSVESIADETYESFTERELDAYTDEEISNAEFSIAYREEIESGIAESSQRLESVDQSDGISRSQEEAYSNALQSAQVTAQSSAEALQAATDAELDALLDQPFNTDERAGMRALGFTDAEITATLGPESTAGAEIAASNEAEPGSNPEADRGGEVAQEATLTTELTGDDRARNAELFIKTKRRLIDAYTGKSTENVDELSNTLAAKAADKSDPQSSLAAQVLDNFDGWKGNYEQRQEQNRPKQSATPAASPAKAPQAAPEITLANIGTYEAAVARKVRKLIDDVTRMGTQGGKRPLDTRWATGAIKRGLAGDILSSYLKGSQEGVFVGAKIALSKANSIEDLAKVAAKLEAADAAKKETKSTQPDEPPQRPAPDLATLKIKTQVFVEELGKPVTVETNAAQALNDAREDVNRYEALMKCMRG